MDSTNFRGVWDDQTVAYMENLILKASLDILSDVFSVKTNSHIPNFDVNALGCNDRGNMTLDDKYKTQASVGDFLLFAGTVLDVPDPGYGTFVAYASACAVGK